MSTHVIMFEQGRMLAWDRHPVPPEGLSGGFRPFVWTADLIDAEKFGCEAGAGQYARSAVPHDQWRVVCVARDEEDCA